MISDVIGDFIQVLTLLVLLVVCFRYARQAEDKLYLIFTALAFATILLSDLYYMTHTYLREGMRVPFSASDIADFGTFLLLGTALSSALTAPRKKTPCVTVGALLFAAANIVLWIGWSGEWVRDIYGGLSYGWFILVCFRSLCRTEALRREARLVLWTACAVLVAVQSATFFVPAGLKTQLDLCGTVLMAAVEVWLLACAVLSLRRGRREEEALSLSFTSHLWVTISMYMSEGLPYEVFANLMTLHLLLILLAVRKKVKAA